ncbi:hypothetical protein [Marmoricola sp. URHB0036]|uniref:hypothetical protein n=1 Tax=Marmoricola sp. URHB0036 TaxID=1298863 RepID=UPI000421EDCC|nr:hypothetical protein [Marmoricola sp. URHB0036]
MIDQPAGGLDIRGGDVPFASMGDLGLDKRKVTQCALSRICGVCGDSLARPVAFLGSEDEAERNEFHFPPTHRACAEAAIEVWGSRSASLGHASQPSSWALVTTSGFEFVRPTAEWVDRRPVFAPNSVIEDVRLPAS